MAAVDVSEGARELVDLNAEAVCTLGEHLKQIGDIIAESTQPPRRDAPRSTAKKVADTLELYKAYCADVARRRAEIDKKTAEDFERMQLWRKECGTEGATLVEELEKLYEKVREMKHIIEAKDKELEEKAEQIEGLNNTIVRKNGKLNFLAEVVVAKKKDLRSDRAQRAGVSSWLQCTIDNIKFKFKADQERERLKIEHQKRLRKAACERRLKALQQCRELSVLQKCMLALQEETVERRAERHLEELRRRYEDHVLILSAQLAQALGDEEKAKELVAEQVRRLEEEKRKAKESERAMREAQKDARTAREERDKMRIMRDKALTERDEANRLRALAEADAAAARAEAADANERAEEYKEAMVKAEQAQRELEELMRRKNKKIKNLQRMIQELGAESDSDAPPDERPPAFFVNEDGSKKPRERTRKERMNMAYREAETARWELRLGMAAMVDKEVGHKKTLNHVLSELDTSRREVQEVRWANKVLHADIEAAGAAATEAAQKALSQSTMCMSCGASTASTASSGWGQRLPLQRPASADFAYAPLLGPPAMPLSSSLGAVPPWSPTRPQFVPAGGFDSGTPRLLLKTASQPILMPPLCVSPTAAISPEKLAPLRKLRRPPVDFRCGWH